MKLAFNAGRDQGVRIEFHALVPFDTDETGIKQHDIKKLQKQFHEHVMKNADEKMNFKIKKNGTIN